MRENSRPHRNVAATAGGSGGGKMRRMTPKLRPIRGIAPVVKVKRSDVAAAVKAVMHARQTDSLPLVDRLSIRKLVERPRK